MATPTSCAREVGAPVERPGDLPEPPAGAPRSIALMGREGDGTMTEQTTLGHEHPAVPASPAPTGAEPA